MGDSSCLWVIGGDRRSFWAARHLRAKGIPVKTWGVPGEKDQAGGLADALSGAKWVLLPVTPFQREQLVIAGEKVDAVQLPWLLGEQPLLIGGSFPERLDTWLREQGVECVGYLDQETYLLQNAAVTAEGAIQLGMDALERTVRGIDALVIGWGRIGRFLAEKLLRLGANVTVAVRRREQRTEAALLGMKTVETGTFEHGLSRYGLIYNTVPEQIMTDEMYDQIDGDAVVIELASPPGGFPEKANVINGRGLPGKTAPRTAGGILAEATLRCLKGEGRRLE